MVKQIEANIGPGDSNLFNISRIDLDLWPVGAGATKSRPLNNFTAISPVSAILRAKYNEESDYFKLNAGKQTFANFLMALGLSKLFVGSNWDQEIINNSLIHGDKLYEECMERLKAGKLALNSEVAGAMEKQRAGGLPRTKLRSGGNGTNEGDEQTKKKPCRARLFQSPRPDITSFVNEVLIPRSQLARARRAKPRSTFHKSRRNFMKKNIKEAAAYSRKSSSQTVQIGTGSSASTFVKISPTSMVCQSSSSGKSVTAVHKTRASQEFLKYIDQNPHLNNLFNHLSQMYPHLFKRRSEIQADIALGAVSGVKGGKSGNLRPFPSEARSQDSKRCVKFTQKNNVRSEPKLPVESSRSEGGKKLVNGEPKVTISPSTGELYDLNNL